MPSPSPAPATPSATVMLVRDRPDFEVLMVRRHHEIEFASGALVFPGGKVEAGDGDPGWAAHLDDAGGLDAPERALRICAIREAFEESGVLAAHGAGAVTEAAAAARAEVAAGETAFRNLVAALGVRLDLGAMTLFAHWITPSAMKKRFDTRFYLLTAPEDQIAACDGHETVDAEWIAPARALALGESGERTILFPTRLNLTLLAQSDSVADAVRATGRRKVVPIEPTLSRDADGRPVVSIPADVGYGEVGPHRP